MNKNIIIRYLTEAIFEIKNEGYITEIITYIQMIIRELSWK